MSLVTAKFRVVNKYLKNSTHEFSSGLFPSHDQDLGSHKRLLYK